MNANDLMPHIGKTISFQLYPSAVISDDFTDVILEGVTSYNQVTYIDPQQMHVNVYPTLPPNSPNDYRAYLYALIRLPSGKNTAIGLPWIDATTFSVASNTDIIVTIRGKGVDDIQTIRQILTGQGFSDLSIVTHSN